jgi:hypothetical protein
MSNKNLIISAVGDDSFHKEWINGNPEFDLILKYYGNNNDIFSDYTKDALMCVKQKGQKFPLIKAFINDNFELVSKYEYIWLPDDDISISTDNLNNIFTIAKEYNFCICQPSVISTDGKVSHDITRPRKGLKLRFTDFVEVMMPLFDIKTLLSLYDDFSLSESGWGLDASWSHRLNYPINKIGIIDKISALHTKPAGSDYSRFKINPEDELHNILQKYGIPFTMESYSSVILGGGLVNKFFYTKHICKEKWRKIKRLWQ